MRLWRPMAKGMDAPVVPDEPAPVVDTVVLVLLSLELGEDADHLAWRLAAEVRVDAAGFRCVPAEVARREITAKRCADETARLTRERVTAAVVAAGQRADRERAAVLAAVDERQARFGGDDALATVYAAALDDAAAEQEPLLAELAERERTARRYDSDGQLVDEHGRPIAVRP